MRVKDYLQSYTKYTNVTFIKARARKDANTPYYHAEYQTTPFRTVNELKDSALMNYYILNDKQCPIDWLSGALWKNLFDKGHLLCLLIINSDDLELLYPGEQSKSLINYIDQMIKKSNGGK